MIGQTFTLIGRPKLVFRLVWRGSIGGIDCVRASCSTENSRTSETLRRRLFISR